MDATRDNLQRSYDLFIEQEALLPFFRGLAGYVDYALSSQPYKDVFQKQLAEYDAAQKKISELESQILEEMVAAKDELAAIIKKRKLDVKTFERFQSWQFNENTDLFQEFDSFLHGRSVGNGFRSDSLDNLLFDLAANLLVLGHKKDIQKFNKSKEEYSTYYARVNGPEASLTTGNVHGNFVFSATWPERWEYNAKFKRERALRSWGSFVQLYQFKQVYDTVAQNKGWFDLLQNDGTEHNRTRTSDRIRTANMAKELESLLDERSRPSSIVAAHGSKAGDAGLRSLKKSELKSHAQVVHNYLLQDLSVKDVPPLAFDSRTGRLRVREVEIKMPRSSDQYDLLRVIFVNENEVGKEWFFDEIIQEVDPTQSGKKFIRKYYNAAYQLNRKLAAKGVKDFFILNTDSAKITPHYLP